MVLDDNWPTRHQELNMLYGMEPIPAGNPQAPGNGFSSAEQQAPALARTAAQVPQAQVPQAPGAITADTANSYMQDGLRARINANPQEPINQPAAWQIRPQGLVAPREDFNRDARLSAAAAAGIELPQSPGEQLFSNAGVIGGRNGMSVNGATQSLGYHQGALPPRNSTINVKVGGHY